MASSIFNLITIVLVISLLVLLGELLHWMFAPREPKRVRLSHALDDLFLQSGHPRYSIRHVDRLIFIHFIWIMFGGIALCMSSYTQDLNFAFLPLCGLASLLLGIWWAWRRGVLK